MAKKKLLKKVKKTPLKEKKESKKVKNLTSRLGKNTDEIQKDKKFLNKANTAQKTKEISKAIIPEIVESVPVHHATEDLVDSSSALVPTDALSQYLAEIRKYPLLTPEEEKSLAIKYYEKGDPIAAEKLVTSNLRFVVKIALEYAKMGAKLMDVIQEGNVGLMHAVKEYNPYKGVKLITYAVWWIRGYIREYLLKQFSVVKIATTQNQKKLFYNLEKEKKKLQLEGKDFSPALLGTRMGIPEQDIELMNQRLNSKDVSLDTPVDDDGNTLFIDTQSGKSSNPELELEVLELIDLLKEKIEEIRPKLNPKELDILENRILADEPQTLQEIGDRHGITRERARQLEERLFKNLKENFLSIAHSAVTEKLSK